MQARLKVLHHNTSVQQVKLLPMTVIGRSTECDLRIASSQVSRVHCRMTVRDEEVSIEDLGSANGTLVNGQLLEPHQPMLVEPGTKITIGPAEFMVDYVLPTSNTVVVRRSKEGPKPALLDTRSAAEGSDRELIFTSTAAPSEEVEEEGTLVAEKLPSVALPVAAAVRAPLPSVAPKLAVSVPAAPPVAKTVTGLSGTATAVKATSVKATVVRAVSATAQAVAPAPRIEPSEPQSDRPLPFIEAKLPKEKVPNDLRNVPNASPTNAVPTSSRLPEALSFATPAEQEEIVEHLSPVADVVEFDFSHPVGSTNSAKASPKSEQSGPLKSLFSMFARKQNATEALPSTSASTAETVAETEGSVGNSPIGVIAESPLEPNSETPVEADNGSNDEDDFQKFLRQF